MEPTATQTPSPTATPDLSAIVAQGGSICENTISQPAIGGTIKTPLSALIKTDRDDAWKNIRLNLPIEAKVLQDVQTLICIKEINVKEGVYLGGSAVAYRRNWDVNILSWPDGALLVRRTFEGGPPPFQISINTENGYGDLPDIDLTNWLSKFSDRLFFGEKTIMGQISPNDNFGASVDNGDASIKLWDAKLGKIIYTLGAPKSDGIQQLVFSPNSKLLASVKDRSGAVQVWSVETGKLVFTPNVTKVGFLTFSPDNETFATLKTEANKTFSMMIWSTKSGKLLKTLKDTSIQYYIQYSPDSKLLAGIAGGNSINFWDIQTQKMVRTIDGQNNYPDYLEKFYFSYDGKFLASVSSSQEIKLWNVETGLRIATFGDPKISKPDGVHYMDASFTPDGKSLILYSFPDRSETKIDLNSLP